MVTLAKVFFHLKIVSVLARVAIAVMRKHHDQKQPGEERVYLACAYTSLLIIDGSQDRNSNKAGTGR